MKFAVAFACLLVAISATQARPTVNTFEEYKKAFNKHYASAEEEAIRKRNFEESLKYVQENEGVEINHFSDLSLEEFTQQYTLNMDGDQIQKEFYDVQACQQFQSARVPSQMDLRTKGYLTPVRNQEACGSCWAFATLAATESAYAGHQNLSMNLSEQELVDCASQHGCRGDTLQTGMEYVKTKGVVREQEYPYQAKEGQCQHKQSQHYKIRDYCIVYPSAVDKIKQALAQTQTAIAAIIGIKDMNQFRHYNGQTVLKHDNGGKENWHAVNIVGFTQKQGTECWIVRNSWGQQWGEEGYAYFDMHANVMKLNDFPYVTIM